MNDANTNQFESYRPLMFSIAYRMLGSATEAFIKGTFTSRADLADCMLRQVSDKRYLRKPVAVTTSAVKPNLLSFLGKEAFQRRPG
jgi:hypothetical protein